MATRRRSSRGSGWPSLAETMKEATQMPSNPRRTTKTIPVRTYTPNKSNSTKKKKQLLALKQLADFNVPPLRKAVTGSIPPKALNTAIAAREFRKRCFRDNKPAIAPPSRWCWILNEDGSPAMDVEITAVVPNARKRKTKRRKLQQRDDEMPKQQNRASIELQEESQELIEEEATNVEAASSARRTSMENRKTKHRNPKQSHDDELQKQQVEIPLEEPKDQQQLDKNESSMDNGTKKKCRKAQKQDDKRMKSALELQQQPQDHKEADETSVVTNISEDEPSSSNVTDKLLLMITRMTPSQRVEFLAQGKRILNADSSMNNSIVSQASIDAGSEQNSNSVDASRRSSSSLQQTDSNVTEIMKRSEEEVGPSSPSESMLRSKKAKIVAKMTSKTPEKFTEAPIPSNNTCAEILRSIAMLHAQGYSKPAKTRVMFMTSILIKPTFDASIAYMRKQYRTVEYDDTSIWLTQVGKTTLDLLALHGTSQPLDPRRLSALEPGGLGGWNPHDLEPLSSFRFPRSLSETANGLFPQANL